MLAVLERRISELEARDKELLEKQISLESTAGSARSDAAGAAVAEAQALLDGLPFVPSSARPMAQLDAIIAERAVIAKALKIGQSEQHRLATERAGEIWASHFAEIAKIEKRRVMLALELQQVNRVREMLREKITSKAGGPGYLPTDGVELLGLGDLREEVHWAGERLVADGIATRAEIEKARSDG
ncbi:hypothetical protein [Bradyrhizobium sp. Ash2021]|uniref:hypothetical protein n=1 Tax=Bradyrhizobium sp. Ash2021 TaxID=2954771 RepID=UPI0028163928|nr:hypothetical protein [Bradyrhizobium sp. Ash2021]WMT78859.1 hypothetical protein NL528_22045 [Bradyrhizobium sp. Ash2021]